jgi:hypothetical protein
VEISFLDDRNYIYHNINKTENVKFIWRRLHGKPDDNLYTDSTFKKSYIPLNLYQKSQLIQKFFSNLMKVDSSYAVNSMEAYFVAKQDKIGNLQPILIRLQGDDYVSLTMIILNKENKYISGYNVSGGFNSGADQRGDSVETYEARSYSHLKDNKINTYYIYETDPMDMIKTTASIDSNVFESIIGANGQFKTKQVAKVRYNIPYEDNIKRKKSR